MASSYKPRPANERLSRLLTRILRHKAPELGLKVRSDGYVRLDELMKLRDVKRFQPTLDDIRQVVADCSKQRFSLITENHINYIRANQGHSFQLDSHSLLEEITDASKYPVCVHGTFSNVLAPIRRVGLKRMSRQHIHFSSKPFGSKDIISGMRGDCDVLIHVDLQKAMDDGIKFFISSNGVILSEGVNGVLPPKYFSKIETRVGKSRRFEESKDPAAELEYLVVLDFEATCDDKTRLNPQEIIEFPLVVLNAKTKKVEAEVQHYVRPVVHPQLSAFCTELTGITQQTVDSAKPFKDVFYLIMQFLVDQKLIDGNWKPLKNFAFVTCGDWDLKTMLPKQCSVSGLQIPPIFTEWINLKFIFADHFNERAKGMVGMLQKCSLQLQGRHHSGIDDCRNIARVAVHLIEQGTDFHLTWTKQAKGKGRKGQRGGRGRGRGKRGK